MKYLKVLSDQQCNELFDETQGVDIVSFDYNFLVYM